MPQPTDAVKTGRISVDTLARAVHDVTALDHNAQLALCEQIAADQPNLLAAILAAPDRGRAARTGPGHPLVGHHVDAVGVVRMYHDGLA